MLLALALMVGAGQGFAPQRAQAVVLLLASEETGDVVFRHRGRANLSALTYLQTVSFAGDYIENSDYARLDGGVDIYGGLSGPAFTSGPRNDADAAAGDNFAFNGAAGMLGLAAGAGSAGPSVRIDGSMTFSSTTFLALGLDDGAVYRWDWGVETSDCDFIEMRIGAIPLPAGLDLMLGVMAGLGGLGWLSRPRRA